MPLRTWIATAIGCVAVATVAQAAAPATLDFGGLTAGMTLEQAKAARPDLPWTEVVSEFSGKVVALRAAAAFPLGKESFDVEVRPLAHGAHNITFSRKYPGMDAGNCRKQVQALVRSLEPIVGPLKPGDGIEPFESTINVSDSQVAVQGPPDQRHDYQAHAPIPGRADTALVVHSGLTATIVQVLEGKSSDCLVSAELRVRPPRPAFDRVDFASLQHIGRPSSGRVHYSVDQLTVLPPSPVTIEFDCEIQRPSGQLWKCDQVDPRVSPDLSRAAYLRIGEMAVRGPAMDTDLPLQTRVRVVVGSADRIRISPPDADVLSITAFRWVRYPNSDRVADAYPEEARDQGTAATRVSAICQVQQDLSVACGAASVSPTGAHDVGFHRALQDAAQHFRAGPTLLDGTPSQGRYFTFRIAYQ